ncbi:hypothetical protein LCGC14_1218840 [marine sediment metagenome]|uniref:Phage portal protein n=1 Tax=marine sediment metagenome TaxID=412755 RepID=A0A0F9LZ78_9ZZZZ
MRLWPFGGRKQLEVKSHFGGGGFIFLNNFGTTSKAGQFDYAREVGTGGQASVVMATIQWIQRSMPEAPLALERKVKDEEWEVQDHPLTTLLAQPNPFYSGNALWQGTILSLLTAGNAYWKIIKNGLGIPMELWYIPHWLIRPEYPNDGSEFLTGYVHRTAGLEKHLDLDEVVHFRQGIDPDNPRLGLSPIVSALREIWTDMEASEFIATLLRNSGIPGLIISPDSKDGGFSTDPNDVRELKEKIKSKTTGSHRGEPMIFESRTKMERVSWNPKEMDLSPASDRAEERVTALLGVPAAVVGFSSGLEQTKVGATMTELRRLAWQNGIIPLHRLSEGEIDRVLVPMFRQPAGDWRARFNTREVGALQENRSDLFDRINKAISNGWITVAEGKRELGLQPEPGDEVYLRGANVVPVPLNAPVSEDEENSDKSIPIRETVYMGVMDIKQDDISPLVQSVADRQERTTPTAEQNAFMELQESREPELAAKYEKQLTEFFEDLGRKAAVAAQPILEESLPKELKDINITEIPGRVAMAMALDTEQTLFVALNGRHYLDVAELSTADAMATIGLSTDIPDPVARAIVRTGGTRAGLVDVPQQTKDALFRALEEGRALGEGAETLAKRIGKIVEAGPHSSVEIRAKVIARTETKHAQRTSALLMGKDAGATMFLVLDNRGAGPEDDDCLAAANRIVSAREADELAGLEHPNGTRDFVPHFG